MDRPPAASLTTWSPRGFEAALLPIGGQIALHLRSSVDTTKPVRKPIDAAARQREEQRLASGAVREAERALSAARKEAERAAAKLAGVVARAKDRDKQRAEIEKRLARVAREADAAREQVRSAQADALEATQAADSAERVVGLARRRLEQLTSDQD
jgi:ABC-type transporter Mla subunit MlaD